MQAVKLANTYDEVTRLLGGAAPPITPDVLTGDTRLTGRWRNPPFDGYVPALKEHCLVRHVAGHSSSWVKIGAKSSTAAMVPGTISLVPKGQDSWRRSSRPMDVSNVYLGDECLRSCADQVARGQRVELIDRVGVADPKLFAIMTLIGDEAVSTAPTSRLFVDHLLDLLCLQLLRAHSSLASPPQVVVRCGLLAWISTGHDLPNEALAGAPVLSVNGSG
jgi:AraC family transcriptional regulator